MSFVKRVRCKNVRLQPLFLRLLAGVALFSASVLTAEGAFAADFGDAPDTYGTDGVAGNSGSDPVGAQHTVTTGIHLGPNPPDNEADAVLPFDGTGDGTDEDGVVFLNTLFTDNVVYTVGSSDIRVTNASNSPATLHAWLDFDGNGVFDADEYTSQLVPALTTGGLSRDLEWTGPGVSGMTAGLTYARFRLTTDPAIDSTTPGGLASDGEVEDYAVFVREVGSSNGGVCTAEYGLVYSGQAGNIFAVHVESGAALPLTTNALATANGMATDHVGRLVYYADNNSIFAWDPITQQHSVIENNFTSYLSSVPPGFDLGSGGAAYFGGDLYQGVDTGTFEIYRVEFVPGSEGRSVQRITPIGISAFLNVFNANWGDFIIEDTGVILGQSNGSPQYWSYDLNSGVFTALTAGAGTPSNINLQLAKDGQGRLWGLVTNNTVVQLVLVGTTFQTVGPFRSTGTHGSFDGAECVRGSSIIGDRVWEDSNGDGIQDPGEPDIANVTVDLIWDLNGNGVVDANEPALATRTTNSNGYYEFNELIFGDYIVQVTDTNTVLTDSLLTSSTTAFSVAMPAGINTIDIADFGYQPIANDPEVLLVKRITEIDSSRIENRLDSTPLNTVVNDGVADSADDHANWPSNYLLGAIDGGLVRPVGSAPADAVEYSIYFLSAGEAEAQDVLVCDRIPPNTSFLPDAYASAPPADPLSSQPNLRGIAVSFNGNDYALTGAADGDSGYYFPPGVEPSSQFPTVQCDGANDNGAVVVDLGDLPQSVAVGDPPNAYGLMRFQVQID